MDQPTKGTYTGEYRPPPKVPVTMELRPETLARLKALADKYPHGFHDGDLKIRNDGQEEWYNLYWLQDLMSAVRKLP